MFEISLRPFISTDFPELEEWRKNFKLGRLEHHPDGPDARGIETAVAVRPDGSKIAALTGVFSLALGPFVKDPGANHKEVLMALYALCRALELSGAKANARECYIAVPDLIPEYQSIVRRCGFLPAAEECKLFSHGL